jgi:hypothetical protein
MLENIANGFNRWKQNLIIDMSPKVETLGYMPKTKRGEKIYIKKPVNIAYQQVYI